MLAWPRRPKLAELSKGKNFIESEWYTEAEDLELLKLYEGLRVADVSDGMDMVGLPHLGQVDHDDTSLLGGLQHHVPYHQGHCSDRPLRSHTKT